MFNNISWGSYCYALFITVIIYYLFVIIAFYRHELSHYFQHLNKRFASSALPGFSLPDNTEGLDGTSGNSASDNRPVRTVLEDLSVIIQQGSEREYLKAELLQALRVKLNGYKEMLNDEQKVQIEARIKTDCTRYCSMHLDEEDMKVLWFD